MDDIDLKEIESSYDDLISQSCDFDVTPKEAERLSRNFFKASYEVLKYMRYFRGQMNNAQIILDIKIADASDRAEGKTVTEKKMQSAKDPSLIDAKKMFYDTETNYKYFDKLYHIMENGHKFYKMLIKE